LQKANRKTGGLFRPGDNIVSIKRRRTMTSAYYSAVLDHPLDTVWSLIRDLHNYPAYIEGVSESVIEDNRRGDEVGAIRRFCYRGNRVRQRLAAHSDEAHLLTHAGIEPLPFPSATSAQVVSPTAYEGTMRSSASSSATALSSSVRSGCRQSLRMRSAGTRCSSPGFRTGRARSRERWRAARADLAYRTDSLTWSKTFNELLDNLFQGGPSSHAAAS